MKAGQHIFLLVTLDKAELATNHQCEDRFLEPDVFQWQSQNRTSQSGSDGQAFRHHRESGVAVHLFVRPEKRKPFVYCGEAEWTGWRGDKPITVTWRLAQPLPERLRDEFGLV